MGGVLYDDCGEVLGSRVVRLQECLHGCGVNQRHNCRTGIACVASVGEALRYGGGRG